MISRELFDRAQARLKEAKEARNKVLKSENQTVNSGLRGGNI